MARDALAQVRECERRWRRKEYDGDVEECTETVEVACGADGGLYFRMRSCQERCFHQVIVGTQVAAADSQLSRTGGRRNREGSVLSDLGSS